MVAVDRREMRALSSEARCLSPILLDGLQESIHRSERKLVERGGGACGWSEG